MDIKEFAENDYSNWLAEHKSMLRSHAGRYTQMFIVILTVLLVPLIFYGSFYFFSGWDDMRNRTYVYMSMGMAGALICFTYILLQEGLNKNYFKGFYKTVKDSLLNKNSEWKEKNPIHGHRYAKFVSKILLDNMVIPPEYSRISANNFFLKESGQMNVGIARVQALRNDAPSGSVCDPVPLGDYFFYRPSAKFNGLFLYKRFEEKKLRPMTLKVKESFWGVDIKDGISEGDYEKLFTGGFFGKKSVVDNLDHSSIEILVELVAVLGGEITIHFQDDYMLITKVQRWFSLTPNPFRPYGCSARSYYVYSRCLQLLARL